MYHSFIGKKSAENMNVMAMKSKARSKLGIASMKEETRIGEMRKKPTTPFLLEDYDTVSATGDSLSKPGLELMGHGCNGSM
ncbi:hypothetical protein V6N13_133674 [Hibiscus sabdariffa]